MLVKSLHNFGLTASLLLTGIALNAPQSIAHPLDFVFHNHTPFPVARLYVSPANTNNWEEDVLGVSVLPSGQSIDIRFNGNYNTCYFDIMAVFTDDSYIERRGFNLCNLTDITLP